jgi:hypothetical protein
MRTLCLTVLVALLVSSHAAAGDEEDCEAWLKSGVKLRRAGDHAGALKAFIQAHYLNPSGRTMGQIGLALQSVHEWKRSANALAVALRTSHEWVEKNRKVLEEALVMVKSHIGRVLVTGPVGSDLYVDEIRAGRLPLEEIQMDEGEHVVRVEKAGMKTWSTTVKITGGTTTEVTVPVAADNPASGDRDNRAGGGH